MAEKRKLLPIKRIGIIAPIIRKWNRAHKAGGGLRMRSISERLCRTSLLHVVSNRYWTAIASFLVFCY